MKNKICVYAISKNEEKNVERWYNSMKEADYILVLDTGSTDNTVRMLEEFGADVRCITYKEFAFDKARNDALALVPEEYNVLVSTDIDEAFEPGWAEIIRNEWIDGKHEHAQYAYTWDHLEDGSNGHTFPYNKIHSRNWKWRDAIHETLCRISNGEREYTVDECLDVYDRVHLHHYQDLSLDRSWYVQMARDRVNANPNDKMAYLELIRELCAKQHNNECVEFGRDIINNHKDLFDNIDIASIYHQMGLAAAHNNDAQNAIQFFTFGISNCLEYRDNYVELANTYLRCGVYELSIGIIKQCFITSYELKHWTESALSFSWLPYEILASNYYNLGDYEKAYITIERALAFEPTKPQLVEKHNMFLSAFITNAVKIEK